MRVFQIWSHNLDRIIFDPLFGKKDGKPAKITIFRISERFLLKKGANII